MSQWVSESEYFEKIFNKLDVSSSVTEHASFEECTFNHCNFTSARLSHCKFTHCTFNHCNFSIAEILGSRFYEIDFNECKLSGIDWTRAQWPTFSLDPELRFNKSILTHSAFFGLKLQGMKMDECILHEVDFRECDLAGAEIVNCDLAGSLFHNTDLRGANFTDSWDFQIDVMNNLVARAKFSRQEAVSLLESLGIELVD
ncbi:pentapeptide repeat-containing protein [Rouxiella sp. WC2420]|uniref:Pentapeptide repeat-containing protein n=1 Tax=Rouxiella sp. WC2420 TaxID=3234145 RepID=A0AB39VJS6_9GAMM